MVESDYGTTDFLQGERFTPTRRPGTFVNEQQWRGQPTWVTRPLTTCSGTIQSERQRKNLTRTVSWASDDALEQVRIIPGRSADTTRNDGRRQRRLMKRGIVKRRVHRIPRPDKALVPDRREGREKGVNNSRELRSSGFVVEIVDITGKEKGEFSDTTDEEKEERAGEKEGDKGRRKTGQKVEQAEETRT